MRHYVIKGVNQEKNKSNALVFFRLNKYKEKSTTEEILSWNKIFKSFAYDKDCDFNFIYIKHPTEQYLGFSITTYNNLLDVKATRYSEGLAFLLIKYLPNYNVTILEQDNVLNVLNNLIYYSETPLFLDKKKENNKAIIKDCGIKILFANPINSNIVLNKILETYNFQKVSVFENRIGLKSKLDKELLYNPYLIYKINTCNLKSMQEKNSLIDEIFEYMKIPNKYLKEIIEINNFLPLKNNIRIVSFENLTEYILEN